MAGLSAVSHTCMSISFSDGSWARPKPLYTLVDLADRAAGVKGSSAPTTGNPYGQQGVKGSANLSHFITPASPPVCHCLATGRDSCASWASSDVHTRGDALCRERRTQLEARTCRGYVPAAGHNPNPTYMIKVTGLPVLRQEDGR